MVKFLWQGAKKSYINLTIDINFPKVFVRYKLENWLDNTFLHFFNSAFIRLTSMGKSPRLKNSSK